MSLEIYRKKSKKKLKLIIQPDICRAYFTPVSCIMMEVQGTAPWSKMFITNFVYRYSWKTNKIIIQDFSYQ